MVVSLTALELAKRPFTIIRTHLRIHIASDQLIADELQVAALGMCVVSDQALAIGVTAVPTPITDNNSDLWFLHQFLVGDFTLATAIGFDASGGHDSMVDSKAMRRVNDDEDVLLAVEVSAASNGAFISTMGRLLIKEH